MTAAMAEIDVPFQAARAVRRLRVDPVRGAGEVRFESIELLDAGGKVLQAWAGPAEPQ